MDIDMAGRLLGRVLAKLAASGLRDRIKIVQNQMHPEQFMSQGYSAMLGDKRMGTMLLDHPEMASAVGEIPQVHWSNMDPSFSGMGVGPKMYGEVMRQLPNGPVMNSDQTLSPGSKKVYERMGRTPGYTVAQNPSYTDKLPDISGSGRMNTWHHSVDNDQSMFEARLPAAAQKKPAGPSNEFWNAGQTEPQYKDPTKTWEFGRDVRPELGDTAGLRPAQMTSPQRQALIDQKKSLIPRTAPAVGESVAPAVAEAPALQSASALGERFPATLRAGPVGEGLGAAGEAAVSRAAPAVYGGINMSPAARLGRAGVGLASGVGLGAVPGAIGGALAGWNVPPPGESRGHAALRQGLQGAWETGIKDPVMGVKDLAQTAIQGYASIPGAVRDVMRDPRGSASAAKDMAGQAYHGLSEMAQPVGSPSVSSRANTPGLFNPMWGGSAVRGGRAVQQ